MKEFKTKYISADEKEPILFQDYSTTITILEHIPDALFVLNAHGGIQYANKTATEILRIDLADIIGKNILDFLMPDFNAAKNKSLKFNDYISQDRFSESESALIHKQYSTPVFLSIGIIKNEANEIKYIILSAKDIAEKKQFEKELKEKQELAFSRDKIKALGDLAINLVHELTQPVSTLKLNLELMQRNLHSNKSDKNLIKKNIDQVKNLIDRMALTLENMRNFALKVEDDSFRLIDINVCIQNTLKQLEYEFLDKKINVEYSSTGKIPVVTANQVSLEYTIATLIKFCQSMTESKKSSTVSTTIQISLYNIEKNWVEIKIENKDTADLSQSSEFDLNIISELSIIRTVISSFGGEIKIYRKQDMGYSILVRIPADHKEERAHLINLFDLLPRE